MNLTLSITLALILALTLTLTPTLKRWLGSLGTYIEACGLPYPNPIHSGLHVPHPPRLLFIQDSMFLTLPESYSFSVQQA